LAKLLRSLLGLESEVRARLLKLCWLLLLLLPWILGSSKRLLRLLLLLLSRHLLRLRLLL
jgi:hypothetical protein